jgi:alkylation response protein AidB-like acyl-CoA dehydrogenase
MIDFALSPEQLALCETIRTLMTKHATPEYLTKLDRESLYPHEIYRRWADSGLLALPFPERVGGQGGSVLDFVFAVEELGRWGYDIASVYATPIFCGLNILHNGSDELREQWLPALMDGSRRFSVSISEPEAGSDAGGLKTRARRTGSDFVISGEKIWASGAGVEKTVICLYARTDPESTGGDGITCFLVPNDTPGIEIRPVPTLGRHMFPTTQLFLNDVVIPQSQVVGQVGNGWQVLLSGLRIERLVTSAMYVGNARTVVDEALAYAKERVQFGRRIGDFQAMAHLLADMHTSVEAARYLMWRAAWEFHRGGDALEQISMAKLFGSEVFADVANKGMQVLGGYGFSMEFPMQRHFRTARAATITAGTSQMQRNLIARKLGLRPV